MRSVSATRIRARGIVVAAAAITILTLGLAAPAWAAPGPTSTTPDLASAVHFLATTTTASGSAGTSLAKNGYYESFGTFGDFGLTMDGALALAAAGTDNTDLAKVLDFIDQRSKDGSGNTIDTYTGIGTAFAGGGSIGKEALLAEVTGNDPRSFGGHDLIAALEKIVCTTTDANNGCSAPGNYLFATSTFSQSLGIMAQVRAGDATNAVAAIAYLESLQNAQGAWPSVLPAGPNPNADVDSTAMAAMTLALLPNDATASAAVAKAEAWIASQQVSDGGFNGAAGESTNSTALAIQGLALARSTYSAEIAKARVFLAGEQNTDGGFSVGPGGQMGSDVRASTQAVGGIVGASFGTLSDIVSTTPVTVATSTTTISTSTSTTTTAPPSATLGTTATTTPTTAVAAAAAITASATLPRTGAGMARSLQWAGVLLTLGLAAMSLGRRRDL